ncbi:MAG TPA: HAD family hydrolase [Phycisphaerae bacterium]|nr:HAD family hydrolase [Phycisphaerae bacterium]
MKYRLVIFDMDGTLTEELIDFAAIRAEMGLPVEGGILEHMKRMTGEERARAAAILDRHEAEAAERCGVHEGAAEVLVRLRVAGVRTALLTRNSRGCAERILGRHGLELEHVATREDLPHKPHPDSILNIVRRMGVEPRETLMVGDYVYDLQAAQAAGVDAALVLTRDGGRVPEYARMATVCVRDLRELLGVLEGGRWGENGEST